MISSSLWAILFLFIVAIIIAGFSIYRWQSRRRSGVDSFIAGLLALVENDHQNAAKHLKNAASQDTQNIEAFIILGDLLRQRGEISKAKQIHTSLLARAFIKTAQKARVYKSLALDAMKEKKYAKAVEYIQQAIALKSDRWSQELLLDILEHMEHWSDAYSLLSKLGGDERILALYKVEMGKAIVSDDAHKARIIFKEALRLDSNCISAMLAIGDAYALEKRLKKAVEWWTKALENFPDKARLVIDRLEEAYYELGEFDKSRELYRRMLKSHPDADDIRLAFAAIFEKMGEYEKAKTVLHQAPKQTRAISLAEARIECISGNTEKVTRILESIIHDVAATSYICESCGYNSEKPLWHCPNCGEWNSFGI